LARSRSAVDEAGLVGSWIDAEADANFGVCRDRGGFVLVDRLAVDEAVLTVISQVWLASS
jgi:hypothetical protein